MPHSRRRGRSSPESMSALLCLHHRTLGHQLPTCKYLLPTRSELTPSATKKKPASLTPKRPFFFFSSLLFPFLVQIAAFAAKMVMGWGGGDAGVCYHDSPLAHSTVADVVQLPLVVVCPPTSHHHHHQPCPSPLCDSCIFDRFIII